MDLDPRLLPCLVGLPRLQRGLKAPWDGLSGDAIPGEHATDPDIVRIPYGVPSPGNAAQPRWRGQKVHPQSGGEEAWPHQVGAHSSDDVDAGRHLEAAALPHFSAIWSARTHS
ncbi:hypothetical protein WJX84_011110 [Apatococcus fuscideae]|uniref:Uncharacterized protein n=1 Tax=Apatococcus fuscideae TaxID=2026836 RepID=A0AAW1SNL4_9CHLO